MKRTEDNLRDLWDNIKWTNIQIIGVPEQEEKNKGYEKIFEEIIIENFPNMEKEIVNQVQEAQRVPYRINPRRSMPRHILIKLAKAKHEERIQTWSSGKGDLKENKFKKNYENAEKYYTNEGTNQKHRSLNKWRGNRQITWKRIQNNNSKDDQNHENRMEKMQELINQDLEELKNKHTETNNTITEIKNTQEAINSRRTNQWARR